jgi:hypothetical protein
MVKTTLLITVVDITEEKAIVKTATSTKVRTNIIQAHGEQDTRQAGSKWAAVK